MNFLRGAELKREIQMENREKFLENMKVKLLTKKEELTQFLKEMSKSDDTSGERQVMDSADQATSINMQKLQSSLQQTEISEVKLIEDALSRIDKGEYGICVDCEKPIADARLEYYPYAARCISCQEMHEG